jgi:hypothetical protein
MKLPKMGLFVLGSLAISLAAGFSTSAQAQIMLKVSVQEVLMKKPTAAEMKDPKSLARKMQKKVIDERTMQLTFGTPKEILLPNGNRMYLTANSYNAGTKILRLHVRTRIQDSGFESDLSAKANIGVPMTGGLYEKHLLTVWLIPVG